MRWNLADGTYTKYTTEDGLANNDVYSIAETPDSARYSLTGDSAILAELKTLHIRPLPCERTVERVLERNGMTIPRVRLARFLPKHVYPTPQAQRSNQLHLVNAVGPIYLKGQPFMSAMCCRFYLTFVGQLCAVGQQIGTSLRINQDVTQTGGILDSHQQVGTDTDE